MYVFHYTRVNKSRIWNQCLNKNSYKILTTPTRLEQLLSYLNEKHAAYKAESILNSFSCVKFFVSEVVVLRVELLISRTRGKIVRGLILRVGKSLQSISQKLGNFKPSLHSKRFLAWFV